jgi:hypothetical protein
VRKRARCDAFAVFLVNSLGAIPPTVSATCGAARVRAFSMFVNASFNPVWLSVWSIKTCASVRDRICSFFCCRLPSQVLFPPTVFVLHIAACVCGPRKLRGCYIDFVYLTIQGGKMRASVHGRTRLSRNSLTFDSFSSFRLLDHLHHPMNIPDSIDSCSTHVLLL